MEELFNPVTTLLLLGGGVYTGITDRDEPHRTRPSRPPTWLARLVYCATALVVITITISLASKNNWSALTGATLFAATILWRELSF